MKITTLSEIMQYANNIHGMGFELPTNSEIVVRLNAEEMSELIKELDKMINPTIFPNNIFFLQKIKFERVKICGLMFTVVII